MAKKILLVSRNDENAGLIRKFLTDLGYNVKICVSGEEAPDFAVHFQPDLVISAADLPVFSGLELAGTFKSSHKLSAIPFLLLTVRKPSRHEREARYARNGRYSGPDDFLTIPVTKMDLYSMVNRWLEGEGDVVRFAAPSEAAAPEKPIGKTPPLLTSDQKPGVTTHRGKATPYNVGKLLELLAHTKGTGNIRLISVRKKMKISVRDGVIVDVISNYIREGSLGLYLIRKGKITSAESETAFARAEQSKIRHGEMLVQMGFLTKPELAAAVAGQKEEKIFGFFTRAWEGGEFESKPEEVQVPAEISLRLPIDPTLKRALMEKMPIEMAEEYFTRKKETGEPMRFSVRVAEIFQRFDLGLSQRKLLERIKGRRLDEVKSDSAISYPEALRLVFFMTVMNAVRFGIGERDAGSEEPVAVSPAAKSVETPQKTGKIYDIQIPQTEGKSFEQLLVEGREMLDAENIHAAHVLLGKACRINPKSSVALAMATWVEYRLADKSDQPAIEKLKEIFKTLINNEPLYEMPHIYLGKILKAENSQRQAAAHFKAALKINPDNEEAQREVKLLEIKLRTKREKGLDS